MPLRQLVEVCLNCIGYAYEQVSTSHIDVLGLDYEFDTCEESELETKKRLLTAFTMLNSLTPRVPYFDIDYGEFVKYLGFE